MLLLVYRSIVTVLLTLVMVVLELSAARGMVAFLGYFKIIGLSTFATNLLVTLAIAAATDYAIFLIGRYQEARAVGESREDAYYTMYKRHRARGARVGPDHRRRDILPALHQPAVFPDAGHPVGHRHGGRGRGGFDAGSGGHLGGYALR